MTARAWRFRAGALLAAGALAVHELRYLLTYGDHAHEALALQGHAYLTFFAPVVGVLLGLAVLGFVVRLLRPVRPAPETPPPTSFASLWARASGTLMTIYAAQESLEGQLDSNHPAGLAGVLGHGGWLAIVLAVALGAAIALLLRGADAAIRRVMRRRPGRWEPRAAVAAWPALPWARPAIPDPVARHLAGRGPPLRLA